MFESKYRYSMITHNTSALSATQSVAEGFIRPSASDPNVSSWLPTNSFYARGQQITGPHIKESDLVRMLKTAQNMLELAYLDPWQSLAAHSVDTVISGSIKEK